MRFNSDFETTFKALGGRKPSVESVQNLLDESLLNDSYRGSI